MKRILLRIEYVGTNFFGWQRQKALRSVQEEVETAIVRLTGKFSCVQGSGRTDKGVHALGQMAHFDTESRIPARQYVLGLNHYLPPDVKVRDAWEVPPDFHARFDAREKTYRYNMYVSRATSPVREPYALHVIPPLDFEKMFRAAEDIPGTHDFKNLHGRTDREGSTVRTVTEARLALQGEDLTFTITGNGFLYNMVRLTVGTLLWIGYGKFPEDHFRRLFAEEDCRPGKCVSGKGLFLMDVKY